jgi:hypothetical protein
MPPRSGIWQAASFGLTPSLDLPTVLDAQVWWVRETENNSTLVPPVAECTCG